MPIRDVWALHALESMAVAGGQLAPQYPFLGSIIVDDAPPFSKHAFGTAVNDWIKKMFGKAIDGAWQVGTGTAGGILTKLLENYYGL